MALHVQSKSVSPEVAGYSELGINPNWNERLITAVAAALAVLVVAGIAVLMGMA